MKKTIANLCLIFVVMICGYLVIANVEQVHYYRSQSMIVDFSNGYFMKLRSNLEELEETLSSLKNVAITTEQQDWVKTIEYNVTAIKNHDLWSLKNGQVVTLKDIANFQTTTRVTENVSLIKELEEKNPNIDYASVYTATYLQSAYQGNDNFLQPYLSHEYHSADVKTRQIIEPDDYLLITKVVELNYDIVSTNYIANLVLQEITNQNGGVVNE